MLSRVIFFDTLDSTNLELFRILEQAQADHKDYPSDYTVVIANHQTAGYGKQNRMWFSPVGNFYASALCFFYEGIENLFILPFISGIAIMRALQEEVAKTGLSLKLKWPNDIIFDEAKLGGILIESNVSRSDVLNVIIGIGINLLHSPNADVNYPTISLADRGVYIDRLTLLSRILNAIRELRVLFEKEGPHAIFTLWQEYARHQIGDLCKINVLDRIVEGQYMGLDQYGRFGLKNLNKSNDSIIYYSSGDVSFV